MSPETAISVVSASRDVMARHARSFDLAARFLPAAARDDAAVLYALCRLIDDTADLATDTAAADHALMVLRGEVTGARPARPLVAAALTVLSRGGVGTGPLLHLIDGVHADLVDVAIADDRELLRYAYAVAGTVGLMMCAALGVRDPRAHAFAIDLGVGMQLVNIARDVAEDAARGRTYLPASRLRAVGVEPGQLLAGNADRAAVAGVVLDVLALADRYTASGEAGLGFIPARPRLGVAVASRVYAAIGAVLRSRGGDALAGRSVASPWRKAGAVFGAVVAWATTLLPRVREHEARLHGALVGLPGARVSA